MGAAEALEVLSRFEGKRILVTPGMVELGQSGYEFNRQFGMHAAKCCDEAIIVGKLNGEAIANGLLEAGFSKEKVHMVKNLSSGLRILGSLADASSVVLFENDLPDSMESQ
jgi:UDP-N-acetylmuramoyl-tripeptide--D-alanyl-D-alanine ligase